MKRCLFLLLFVPLCFIGHSEQVNQGGDVQSGSESATGYQGIAEIGYGFRVDNDGLDFLKVNIINGYRVNSWFYMGAGTGLRLYFDNHALFNTFAAYPVIPFFADFRVNLNRNKVSPYLSLDLGYSFDASDNFMGLGWLVNPTAGLAFRISEKLGMHAGIGYDFQRTNSDDPDENRNLHAISIIIGFDF